MKKSKKRSMAVIMTILMLVGMIPSNFTLKQVTAAEDSYLDAATIPVATTISSNTKSGIFTVTATKEKPIAVDANAKTADDGTAFTQRIKLGGAGAADYRSIKFSIAEESTVTIYAMSSSGTEDRTLAICKSDGTQVETVPARGMTLDAQSVTLSDKGEYYITSTASGINVYAVKVELGLGSGVQRADWSSVAAPTITNVTSSNGKITVTYNLLTGVDGADKATVYMYDSKDTSKEIDSTVVGKSDKSTGISASFTPKASGSYVFKVCANRSVEKNTLDSALSSECTYTLPMGTANVNAMTIDSNGGMKVAWTSVDEAESYDIYYKPSDTADYSFAANVIDSADSKQSTTINTLTVGTKYDFQVVAKRGNDVSATPGVATECTVRDKAEREWLMARFGTSTSDTANTISGNIFDGIKLTSCTYKDDNSIESKGGKFTSDGYDGISYYYTKIDAAKENFVIKGTFTVDYINPTPDGQEGFALLVRDSIGENGVNSSAFYTNSVAAIGTKVEYENDNGTKISLKDGIGARFVTGTKSTTQATTDGSMTNTFLPLDSKYTNSGNYIKAGDKFTFTVKKDNTGYKVSYTDANGVETTQTLYGTDELLKLEKDAVYVGFAAARGCNVTVSDISFTTTDPKTDPSAEEKPIVYVDPNYTFSSASTSGSKTYNLAFSANADGVVTIKDSNGKTVVKSKAVTANEDLKATVNLKKDSTTFTAEFTPTKGYAPGDNKLLSSYDTQTIEKTVTYKSFKGDNNNLIVSNTGTADGKGTADSPLDFVTAAQYVQAGQIIVLQGGKYTFDQGIKLERGINGTEKSRIYMIADPDSSEDVVFDFNKKGAGITFWGDYWYVKGISVTNSADTQKGIQLAGSHNVFELVKTYNNGNSGFQVSGTSTETIDKWPSNNLILNCTSYNNADAAMEDADGFASKLTCGEGNVFYGCIAYNNADDGWDCFAKVATGPIGSVTLINCIAYKNGTLLDGTDAGNGNGFKMGGSAISGHHVVKNCIAYENKAKGIDSNSCPDIEVYDCTSYNNQSYNVALYSNNGITTAFKASGIISFKNKNTDAGENLKVNGQDELTSSDNYFLNGAKSVNKDGKEFTVDMFKSTSSVAPSRNDDGSIQMNGYLALKDSAPADAGARLDSAEYAVDSILAQFNVSTVIPDKGSVASTTNPVAIVIIIVAIAAALSCLGYFFIYKKKK